MADETCVYCDGLVDRTDKECPHCHRRLTGKALLAHPPHLVRAQMARQHEVEQSTGTMRCRFCAETIQAAAVVCKHCGKDLTDAAAPPSNLYVKLLAVVGALSLVGVFLRACL